MSIKQNFEIKTISLSLDDFYLTKEERNQLAKNIHPLLAQRGVPGTHDIELAVNTVKSLTSGIKTRITRFDKSMDDRISNQVEMSEGEIGVIVIEGWCFGAEPQFENQLIAPVNELERLKDPDGTCRRYSNNALATSYPKLFKMAHSTIMLRAPDFDSVFEWRLEQEEKLIEKLKLTQDGLVGMSVMSKEETFEFIQMFQRITETCIERMPAKVNHLLQLDPKREIIEYRTVNP
jgi:D-glycerate 3-kinase